MKKEIEEVFQCKAYNHYGSREVGAIASECSANDGLHILMHHNIVQPLNFNHKEKETNIIVTNLNNYSMPLIRYDIGDLGVFVEEKTECKCGVTYPKIKNVVGRTTDFFQNKNIVGISGNIKPDERDRRISEFRSNKSINILVATPGVAREGLTLVEANYSIFFDRNFSLENYLQAQDRIYRISQTKDCYIYKLIYKNSIDEWVDSLLNAKEVAARYGQGDINEEEYKNTINYDFAEILADILKV